jgi:hypothetical protein
MLRCNALTHWFEPASVEPAANAAVAAAWEAEIQERIRKYDSGESVAIPGEDVFAEVDSSSKSACR